MMKLAHLSLLVGVSGHGHVTFPPSTRHGGNLNDAGSCVTNITGDFNIDVCAWFSQPAVIPGKPTLPDYMRSYNVDVNSGSADWSATMPWRAPGTAPVLGSGCGVGGGNSVPLPNGGQSTKQGLDGFSLPAMPPTKWLRGSEQEVGFSISANHGGGYQWRLCKVSDGVSEACFQKTPLAFAGDKSALQYKPTTYYGVEYTIPRVEVPLVKTSEGTFPKHSEWARVPVPSCRFCDQSICGAGLLPNMTDLFDPADACGGCPEAAATYPGKQVGGLPWFKQQICGQGCAGTGYSIHCPPGMTQFPEPLPGISGYASVGINFAELSTPSLGYTDGFDFSIIDKVLVPKDLEPGEYLLSWRWDCEQSHQIWQNCADITIA